MLAVGWGGAASMECSAQAFNIPYNGKREEHVWICGVILELKKAVTMEF
jgi:hypothetical protein